MNLLALIGGKKSVLLINNIELKVIYSISKCKWSSYLPFLATSWILVLTFYFLNPAYSQLITAASNANSLVQNVLLGPGISVSGIKFTGAGSAIGYFNFPTATTTNPSVIGLKEGIILTTGTIQNGGAGPQGPNNRPGTSLDNGAKEYPRLTSLVGEKTTNAAVLEFDFVPMSPKIQFRYVFASEEYPEYVGSEFNDVFAFFISGPGINGSKNIALLPNGSPVTINNVNNGNTNSGPCTNCAYYVYNGDGSNAPYATDPKYIQYNGFTRVLSANANVECGQTYHLILAIADVKDAKYDSGIFLEAKSLTAELPLTSSVKIIPDLYGDGKTIAEGCAKAEVTLKRGSKLNTSLTVPIEISGTATNNIDFNGVPASVLFPVNQTQTTFTVNVPLDAINEGSETLILTFKYKDECGKDKEEVVELIIKDPDPLKVVINKVGPPCINQVVGLTTTITGGFGPFTYLWGDGTTASTNSMTSATPTNQSASVTVTDNSSCGTTANNSITVLFKQFNAGLLSAPDTTVCPGDSFKMSVFGGQTYTWTPSEFLDNPSSPTPTATVYQPVVFNCFIYDECGTKDVSVNVNTFPVNFVVSADTAICIDNSVPLFASGAESVTWTPPTYLDNPSSFNPTSILPNESITYLATGITSDGCTVRDTVYIEVVPTNPVTELIDSIQYCIWTMPTVTASATPGTIKYLWSPPQDVTSTTTKTTALKSITDGYTYCLMTNACGSSLDSLYRVVLIPNVNAGPDTSVCEYEPVLMEATGGVRYFWNPTVDQHPDSTNIAYIEPFKSTIYEVIGVDSNLCRDTAFVNIVVFPKPVVAATRDQVAALGDYVELEAIGSSDGTYIWSPDYKISCLDCQKTAVNPDQTFSYQVEFTDTNGCKAVDDALVVYPGRYFIPNSFTPDGDRVNKKFFGLGVDVVELDMTIYNRWGEVVFRGVGGNPTWDGTYNGNPCKEGTYIWEIKYKDYLNEHVEKTGHVNLLR